MNIIIKDMIEINARKYIFIYVNESENKSSAVEDSKNNYNKALLAYKILYIVVV